uniref:Uncharacterized protein n=1 Tax=Hyaloperonospora arabidopsidis (strain Emoy2) TaxID=559515 RepID=M4BC11_HYAAE
MMRVRLVMWRRQLRSLLRRRRPRSPVLHSVLNAAGCVIPVRQGPYPRAAEFSRC